MNNMDLKVLYFGLLMLAGFLILHVNSQQCTNTLQESIQPCLMVIMNEFNSMGKSSPQAPTSMNMMTIICKQEVKTAMVCIFDVVRACPDLAPSLKAIPGIANMDMNTMNTMCTALIESKSIHDLMYFLFGLGLYSTATHEFKVGFDWRFISIPPPNDDNLRCRGIRDGSPTIVCPCTRVHRVTSVCGLRLLRENCPSIVDAFNYSLKLSKPPTCPDVAFPYDTDDGMDGPCSRADTEKYKQCGTSVVMGLSQLSGSNEDNMGMQSLAAALGYFCGVAKTDLTCFFEGYNKCPDFKMNSDKAGLTMMFQPKPLKDLVMTGCKNINELGKHSECMEEQFKSTQFQNCVQNAQKTYPGPQSPTEPISCNLYNAMKTCLHDNVGDNCDHGVADYLAKWSSVIFRTNEDCTTAAAPTILSSVFLILALFAAVFIF